MISTIREDLGPLLDSPLLGGMDDPSRRAIYRRLIERPAPSGTVLIAQGQPNDRLWFVVEGSVVVERRQADGHLEPLASLSGPSIFGTTTFFRSTLPSASIRATSDLKLWTIDRSAHEALRRDDPRASEDLALAIVRVLSERFDQLDVKITELMAEHGHDHPRATELATFRARLFEDPSP